MKRAAVLLLSTLLTKGNCHSRQQATAWDALTSTHEFNGHVSALPRSVIFPRSGDPRIIEIPILSNSKVGENGQALYGQIAGRAGIQKVDLRSLQAATVPASETIHSILDFAIAASPERMIVAARNSPSQDCALYIISSTVAVADRIQDHSLCPSGLEGLSPSAEFTKMLITFVVNHRRHVEILDLNLGVHRELVGYEHATWSPDGKWIAALDGNRIDLLDSTSLRKVRSLGRGLYEPLVWSPDSKFLLIGSPRCDSYFFSLAALDIQSGESAEIKSSHCKAQAQGYWWVSPAVVGDRAVR